MQWSIKVQGRLVERSEIAWIKQTMRENPQMGRTALSVKLCGRWNWRRGDGQLKDIAARELLRKLEKLELLQLPARQSEGGPATAPEMPIVAINPKKELEARSWKLVADQQRVPNLNRIAILASKLNCLNI